MECAGDGAGFYAYPCFKPEHVIWDSGTSGESQLTIVENSSQILERTQVGATGSVKFLVLLYKHNNSTTQATNNNQTA